MLPMISNVFSSFQSNLPVMWTSFESFVNLPVYSMFSYNRSGDRELKKPASRHSNKPIVKTYNANLKGERRQTETKHKLFFKVIFCQVSLINKRIIYAVLRLASFIEEIDNNVNKEEVSPIYIYTFCSLVTLPVHKPFTFPLECSEFYVVIHHVTRCKPKDHVKIVVVFKVINQYSQVASN